MAQIHLEIRQYEIDATRFRAIPDAERALLVLLGHLVNEVVMLHKGLNLAFNAKDNTQLESYARNCQAVTFARLLAGKLFEGWMLLEKGYFKARLSQQYDPLLPSGAPEGLANLKQYFGRANAIEKVRNNFAFHFSLDRAATASAATLFNDSLFIFLGNENGNSLYHFSEVVVTSALLAELDGANPAKAFDTFIGDSIRVSKDFISTSAGIMWAIMERHLFDERPHQFTRIEVAIPPAMNDLSFPFFIKPH